MSEEHKKPTTGFWISIVLVAVLVYVVSFGPAVWIEFHTGVGQQAIGIVYRPLCILTVNNNGCARLMSWYVRLGISERVDPIFSTSGLGWIH
jgi:hypothetical protein